MEESLELFRRLMSHEYFKPPVILLLSELDQFREKLSSSPVSQYFPDYIGAQDDSKAVLEFFADKFLTIGRDGDRDVHVYCANLLDTNNFPSILKEIEASIILDLLCSADPTYRRYISEDLDSP